MNRQHSPCSGPVGSARNSLVVIALVVVSVSPATAKYADTIYVNNVQCTNGPGFSPDSAFCTIQSALNGVAGGSWTVLAVVGTGTPYREEVQVAAADSGAASEGRNFVLFARGAATIDGSDTTTQWVERYSPDGTKLWAARIRDTLSDACGQVVRHSDSLRYVNCTTAACTSLTIPTGRCNYSTWRDTVFVNFIDSAPTHVGDLAYLCSRRPLRVFASNVTVDGFTVLRSRFDGILLDVASSGRVRGDTVRNCVVRECANEGIDITAAIRAAVHNNLSARNSRSGIVVKTGPADQAVEDCVVRDNTCYGNDDHAQDHGGINGIRIGTAGATAGTGNHVIERNRTYLNEDTGIEVNTSNGNTFRYNQSWLNHDHGFDHIGASANTHVGDLAFGNDRSGFSVESNAPSTKLHNCVVSDNGRATQRQDYELEVIGTARATFAGDYNVIYRPSRDVSACGGSWNEVRDSILVGWRTTDNQATECAPRCTTDSICFGTVSRFATATGNDTHSKSGAARFIDAGAADFRPRWSTAGVDGADTTVAGWRTTDLSGVGRHDCSGVVNAGNPSGAFGDVGPYEYDDGMSEIAAFYGYNTIDVSFAGYGRYGNPSWKPAWYEILVDGVVKLHRDSPFSPPADGWPASIYETVSASVCASHTVQIRMKDEYADTASTNLVTGVTCCIPYCTEGPDLRTRLVGDERADVPLALEWGGANPSRGWGTVTWSVPRANAGASCELALYDVAGRRVATIERGAATPGRFGRQLSFRSGSGSMLPNGLFFLRLRIGKEVLTRTVVLTR